MPKTNLPTKSAAKKSLKNKINASYFNVILNFALKFNIAQGANLVYINDYEKLFERRVFFIACQHS